MQMQGQRTKHLEFALENICKKYFYIILNNLVKHNLNSSGVKFRIN